MGTGIEVNDTLQLTVEQGFPAELLSRQKHMEQPISIESVKGRVFSFRKEGARIFHLDPVRVFLVQNINGKWLCWGHALIQSQQIAKQLAPDGRWNGQWETSGTFVIRTIYDPVEQEQATRRETPQGRSYFD